MKIYWAQVKFDKLKHDTGRAILVSIQNKEVWLPHFAIRNLITNKKLGGNVEVKATILDEKEIFYDESDATFFIKHHKPKKLDPSKITHDETLIKSTKSK